MKNNIQENIFCKFFMQLYLTKTARYNYLESSEEGKEGAVVSVGDVGVDDGCEAEAGDDDAEAGDCLCEADGGWHGGVVGVYTQLRLVTQLPGWRPQDAGRAALSPTASHSILRNTVI